MNKTNTKFTKAISESEAKLFEINFHKHSFYEKGFACYVSYKRLNIIVEFNYGPPEYEVQMILYIDNNKYEFKDLLGIELISKWVYNNRYVQQNERNLQHEILWFIELLKISLDIIGRNQQIQ